MKTRFVILLFVAVTTLAAAQTKIPRNANRFVYHQIDYGEQTDTTVVTVFRSGNTTEILTTPPDGKLIDGYAQTVTRVDYAGDSITVEASYADGATYFYRRKLTRNDIEWTVNGSTHSCSINSNTLVFEMDETTTLNATPLPHYGLNRGVLQTFTRNGQTLLRLVKADYIKPAKQGILSQNVEAQRVSPQELDRIMKERLVVTTHVFDHEQISWGKENAHVEGGLANIPADTVLRYAGGTLILKRISLPQLPHHYQHFVEIHQQSNGDAYDRTGSIFMIPVDWGRKSTTFFDGINQHPDSLPTVTGRDGQRYQGIASDGSYTPLLELVRFFTPFGVGKFNERMKDYGIDWRKETYYRQEITDVYHGGDVVIGAWIGNYDAGGHLLTLDIRSYPNAFTVSEVRTPVLGKDISPLFNTCNVLEMAGQNYGKLFGTDSLTVSFCIPPDVTAARLRYISTGHGGWDGGDEFVPKTNTLLIDGRPAFCHTPWRQDCGCYRDLNPVSGNFWNGLSSSDFSRSGWCPGTATGPTYFDLTPWADGKQHTLTVAIQQGEPVESMFSHWAVSGTIICER